MGYKIDLHTHSIASADGGLRADDYKRALETGQLDYIAVTDHNTTAFAAELHQKLGEAIIIGEEIMTSEGEIVGLYLQETIPAGLSSTDTVTRIIAQGGLVYIPHPFETVRKGIHPAALAAIIDNVDIIEIGNGRAVFQNKSELAKEWAVRHQKAGAASSDSHGPSGWCRSYSVLAEAPARKTLVALLHESTYDVKSPGLQGILYPKLNRLRKQFSSGDARSSADGGGGE